MSEKEKNKEQEIELRSEEFQEVLGSVPPWILRRGITVLAIIIVCLLVGSAIFKYPDIITTTMTLTGSTPPAALVAKANGKLQELNVEDKGFVKSGEYLAVIENPARKEDILQLKAFLKNFDISNPKALPENLHVGHLQSLFSSFYITLFEYREFLRIQYYPQKIKMMKERLTQYDEYYQNLNRQKKIVEEQFDLSLSRFNRDSLLNKKGVLSGEEFETAKNQFLQGALTLENITSTIQSTEMQITQMNESLLDTEFQYIDRKNTLETQLHGYISQLKSEIDAWEQTYVFVAPIDGEVTFTTFWVENQNVTAGEVVFNIIPTEEISLIGKAIMPMTRSGKVKTGQKVNIRFLNFPDNEYGIVIGYVKNISVVPAQTGQEVNNYIVEVDLPNGLNTTYQMELPYLPEMQAQADIITEDYSVLQRFIMPIRKALTEGLGDNSPL